MKEFTLDYPVVKNWEPQEPIDTTLLLDVLPKDGAISECSIVLGTHAGNDPREKPQIQVTLGLQVPPPAILREQGVDIKKSPHGIDYGFFDRTGEMDFEQAVFFEPDSDAQVSIRLNNVPIDSTFPRKIFWDTAINSFRFAAQ